jgi:hypothetical protein
LTFTSLTSGSSIGGALEFGCHRAARAAPGRPEIDDQRHVALGEVAFEPGGVERHRVAVEQRLMALPAASAASIMVGEPLARHPVDRVAMRTDDGTGCIHAVLFLSRRNVAMGMAANQPAPKRHSGDAVPAKT